MLTAQFFLGASLSALLIVDICCLPVKTAFNPSASHGGSYAKASPGLGSNKGGVPSSHFSPVVVMSDGGSVTSVSQPVREAPAASGYRGNVVSSSQPAPALKDMNWAIAPPSIFSGGEEMPASFHGVDSGSAEFVSPPLPPPVPVYQAGELSHFEQTHEHGDYERETEEQGYLPPPPSPFLMHESAAGVVPGGLQPESNLKSSSVSPFSGNIQPGFYPWFGPGSWSVYPYSDYMFLTGQYPPGTVSHFSNSFEQGRDNWQDVHYVREYAPYNRGPVQPETYPDDAAAPQRFEVPKTPVGY